MRSKALFIVSLMIFGGAFSIPFMNDSTLHLNSEIPVTQSSSGLDMINTTISPSEGSNLGGSEITINGNGFTDMAWKNLTSDGNAYTWTTTTANYVTSSGYDPSIGVDSNGTVHIVSSNMDSKDLWHSSYDGSTWTHVKIRDCGSQSGTWFIRNSSTGEWDRWE